MIFLPKKGMRRDKRNFTGVLPSTGKIFLCKLHNLARKQEERNQVWDRHETVEGLGNAPHQAEVCGGAKDGNQRIGGHKIFVILSENKNSMQRAP